MDPNYGFNSPSLGPAKPAACLSRPSRLAKLRKPLAGNRPNLLRPVSSKPVFEPAQNNEVRGFVFPSRDSGKSNFFSENVRNDVESSRVVDDLMRLKIESEKASLNFRSSRNVSSGSSIGTSSRDHNLRGVDESMVSELPDEMKRLYIESDFFTKGYDGNVWGDLPNKMKKLNVKDDERVVGSLDKVLQNKMKDLKIKESLSSLSGNGNNKFVSGNSGKPVGGVPEMSSTYNADKKFEFSFTSKLVAAENVEFKTPDPKGNFAFGFNPGLKKKKGKWKKPAQVPLKFGQDVSFQESSQTCSESFQESSQTCSESSEQYSPMDASPYGETLADNVISRETSVASEESFHIDDNFSSTEEQAGVSNDIADEHLDSVTECLHISEPDIKVSDGQDESTEEGGISGAETESFMSANDELECSCDSFITARDDEVSSGSSQRQDSDAQSKYKHNTSLPDIGQSSFIFGASSTNRSEFSASVSSQKKKNRMRIVQDLCLSTPNVKNSHISSLLSPDQGKKSNFSYPLRHRQDKTEQVQELEAKQDSNTTASIAAQESCEKWRLRGNQAYAKGDFLKAEDCYSQGVNCISENEVSRSCLRALLLCYSNRAGTRMSLGRVREALQDCTKAAALDPNFLRVQVRAGSCYLALGDVENASLHFMKCLQAGSDDACADRKLLIEASEGLEKTRKIAECIKLAEELWGQRTSHNIDSANSLVAEGLTISSYSEKLLQMKVDALLMLKKYDELIQFCEQLLSVESNFLKSGVDHSLEFNGSDLKSAPSVRVWCCTLILKSYFFLGRLEQAVEFVKRQEQSVSLMESSECKNLESMIPLVGTIRELLRHKAAGNEAYQSGNHSEAIEHYTACISCSVESRPYAALCFCNRSAAYRATGQIVDALADCTLAIALDENYFKAIMRRASLYEMIRDYGQAVTDLQKLVTLLTKEVDKKTSPSEPSDSDKRCCVNELRQAQVKLSEMEEAARKEIPLNMYLILGVDQSAAASEIRKAYRKAALKYHPDKAGQSVARNEIADEEGIWKEIAEEVRKGADRLFKMIGEAYAVLLDPTKRARYDMEEEQRRSHVYWMGGS